MPRRGIRLDSRLRATARSEWIKFRSVRSAPLALVATALIVVVGAWLLGAGNRDSAVATRTNGLERTERNLIHSLRPVARSRESSEMPRRGTAPA